MQDFLKSIIDGYDPMINGEEGRKTVEIFTAIYLSQNKNEPVKFPLNAENVGNDYNGIYVQ